MPSVLERIGLVRREIPLQEIEVPSVLNRDSVLMYLVTKEGEISRGQVNALANVLDKDKRHGIIRSVHEAWQEAQVTNGFASNKKLLKDPVLSKVSLSYDEAEYTKYEGWDPFEVRSPNDPLHIWNTVLDYTAGIGSQRPLVIELHKLYSIDGSVSLKKDGYQSEIFSSSGRGEFWSKQLKYIYEGATSNWPGNVLQQIGRYESKAVYKNAS